MVAVFEGRSRGSKVFKWAPTSLDAASHMEAVVQRCWAAYEPRTCGLGHARRFVGQAVDVGAGAGDALLARASLGVSKRSRRPQSCTRVLTSYRGGRRAMVGFGGQTDGSDYRIKLLLDIV